MEKDEREQKRDERKKQNRSRGRMKSVPAVDGCLESGRITYFSKEKKQYYEEITGLKSIL